VTIPWQGSALPAASIADGAPMGRRIPARIRDKLALWFLTALGLQVIVFALVVFVLMQRSLVSQVDRLLDIDARTLTEAMATHQAAEARQGTGAGLVEGLGAALFSADIQAVLWFHADPQGTQPLAATPGAPALPAPNVSELPRRTSATAADGTSYYLRSVEMAGDGGGTYLIEVARPAALVVEPLIQLAWMLCFGFAAVMLLGWFGGRAIASAALAPIQEIVSATRAIRLSRLSRRLRESGPDDELRELTQVINELLQRFQDGLDRERRFASDVSHELRTPLTAQILIAQTALRNPTAGVRDHEIAIQHMLEESRHMEQFIDRLLTLTRIATQPLSTALESVDLHDAILQTAATLQVLSDDKQHKLVVACQPGQLALGEPTMLRQALLNIVHNAIDHCPPGSCIVIRAAQRHDKVVVEVDDDGPGVPAQARSRLFTRFYRGAPRSDEKAAPRRGLGLGLSIVKALMEAQSGDIHLESKEGQGARFCLTFLAAHRRRAASTAVPVSMFDVIESVPDTQADASTGSRAPEPAMQAVETDREARSVIPITAAAARGQGRASPLRSARKTAAKTVVGSGTS
jgi:signal transduction histidine kinase